MTNQELKNEQVLLKMLKDQIEINIALKQENLELREKLLVARKALQLLSDFECADSCDLTTLQALRDMGEPYNPHTNTGRIAEQDKLR